MGSRHAPPDPPAASAHPLHPTHPDDGVIQHVSPACWLFRRSPRACFGPRRAPVSVCAGRLFRSGLPDRSPWDRGQGQRRGEAGRGGGAAMNRNRWPRVGNLSSRWRHLPEPVYARPVGGRVIATRSGVPLARRAGGSWDLPPSRSAGSGWGWLIQTRATGRARLEHGGGSLWRAPATRAPTGWSSRHGAGRCTSPVRKEDGFSRFARRALAGLEGSCFTRLLDFSAGQGGVPNPQSTRRWHQTVPSAYAFRSSPGFRPRGRTSPSGGVRPPWVAHSGGILEGGGRPGAGRPPPVV